jgi:hypothetical protein
LELGRESFTDAELLAQGVDAGVGGLLVHAKPVDQVCPIVVWGVGL